jgi:hypothetical protein
MMATNDAVSRRFETLRKQLRQEETAQSQQQQEALQRRFASIGALGSGASIKTQRKAQDESAKRLSRGQATLGIAESAERQRLGEIEEARKFAREERLGSQEFAGEERLGSQEFSREERLGSQEFAGGQSAMGRALQARAISEQERAARAGEAFAEKRLGIQQDQFGRQLEEKRLGRIDQRQMQDAQLEWQKYVFEKEFPLNERIANANIKNAERALASDERNVFEKIIGPMPTSSDLKKKSKREQGAIIGAVLGGGGAVGHAIGSFF